MNWGPQPGAVEAKKSFSPVFKGLKRAAQLSDVFCPSPRGDQNQQTEDFKRKFSCFSVEPDFHRIGGASVDENRLPGTGGI